MEFKFDISGCSSFQRKSVESLYNKFFEENKSKLVLADEVGMGKTFVCKGLIENAKKIDKKYTVFYVSPNEIITKQNHGELCQGLVEKTTKAVRLSELDDDKINESKDYNIYSFSASMFFSADNKTTGTEAERQRICRFLYSVFECGKESKVPEIKKWATDNELYVQMIISAFFKPRDRYKYYLDSKPNEDLLKGFCEEYKKWIGGIQKKEIITKDELEWSVEYLKEEVEGKITYIKKIIDDNNLDFDSIVRSQYARIKRQLNYDDSSFDVEEKKTYELVKRLSIPYYCSEFEIDKIFYVYFNEFRKFMNLVNIRKIMPDLIILDEFHKYFDGNVKNILDKYIEICPETKVLFVSATPYKMHIKSEEFLPDFMMNDTEYDDADEAEKEKQDKVETNISCFEGYYDLYKYVSGKESGELEGALKKIRENIEKLSKTKDPYSFINLWDECKVAKRNAEGILKEYIIRTERHRLTTGKSNYAEKAGDSCLPEQYLYEAEQFKLINSVLQHPDMELLYCKMAPYPMSFSQGYKSLGAAGSSIEKKASYEEGVFWDGHTEPNHYRFQTLKNYAIPNDNIKKLLWLPPSNVDKSQLKGIWEDGYNYTKTLVFARHIMTTKSIAAILSSLVNFDETDIEGEEEFKSIFIIDENDFMNDIFKEALADYCDTSLVQKYSGQFAECFYKYLETHKKVLLYAGVKNKEDLKEYCYNGCLTDVLKEYFFVLTKGKCLSEDNIDSIKKSLTNQKTNITYFTKDGSGTVACGFAEMFNIDCEKADAVRETMTIRFNSPFYPFVLATTPIAQEGINFQNYCHRIIHWRLPVSPIDFEQREGRINRYRNHAVRKSLAKQTYNKSWKEIFDIKETNGGLSPNWIADVEDAVEIESVVVNHKFSKEDTVHTILKKAVNAYRISLGYGVSKKTLDKIHENATAVGLAIDFNEILIDLSPC